MGESLSRKPIVGRDGLALTVLGLRMPVCMSPYTRGEQSIAGRGGPRNSIIPWHEDGASLVGLVYTTIGNGVHSPEDLLGEARLQGSLKHTAFLPPNGTSIFTTARDETS